MTDQLDRIDVPAPSIGPGALLRVERSQYGDYFDFELLGVPSKVLGDVEGARVVATISGYACRTRLIVVEAVDRDDKPAGTAMLVVGNTTVFLPVEHGAELATFLGIELERG